MKLRIGFSPCPNDTFIFDALVNGKVDTGGLEFEPILEDVETLNQWALEGRLDITKLSFPAFFRSLSHYVLLDAGSALGKGVGPLLVAARPVDAQSNIALSKTIHEQTVALPGKNTTAHLLFSFAFPHAQLKKFLVFSSIEEEVISKRVDLGVIIHENRFTFADKGLFQIMDLGSYWEEKMQTPIPLGGIAIRRSIPLEVARKVNTAIAASLQYAWNQSGDISPYVSTHAQEMEPAVMKQHIHLYVNSFTLQLGNEGKRAIEVMHQVFENLYGEKDDSLKNLFPLFLASSQS